MQRKNTLAASCYYCKGTLKLIGNSFVGCICSPKQWEWCKFCKDIFFNDVDKASIIKHTFCTWCLENVL